MISAPWGCFEAYMLGNPGLPPPPLSPEVCQWLGKGPSTVAKEGVGGFR